MKKFLCLFTTIVITALFILTSCQTTPTEPEVCSTCKNEKSIRCNSCYGRGEGVCQHCPYANGHCCSKDCDGGKETKHKDCTYCTSGIIVNPITWATISCSNCDGLGIVFFKEECLICRGEDQCIYCHGTGLAKDCYSIYCSHNCKEIAGQCKDCQGLGKIDCPDCE